MAWILANLVRAISALTVEQEKRDLAVLETWLGDPQDRIARLRKQSKPPSQDGPPDSGRLVLLQNGGNSRRHSSDTSTTRNVATQDREGLTPRADSGGHVT